MQQDLAIPDQLQQEVQRARLDELRNDLLAATDLEHIRSLHANVSGLERALRQYHNVTFEILHSVSSLCVEAERHMGKILLELPRGQGARTDLTSSQAATKFFGKVVDELGIAKDTVYRWQWMAKVPDTEFSEYMASSRANNTLPTRGHLVEIAKYKANSEVQKEKADELMSQLEERLQQGASRDEVMSMYYNASWSARGHVGIKRITSLVRSYHPEDSVKRVDIALFQEDWNFGRALPFIRGLASLDVMPSDFAEWLVARQDESMLDRVLDDAIFWLSEVKKELDARNNEGECHGLKESVDTTAGMHQELS